MPKRFVVECIWSGYRSSQERPCHRRVIRKYEADEFRKIHTVAFPDNTTMSVKVRECLLRERVQEIEGRYSETLWEFRRKGMEGFCRIQDLIDARKPEPQAEREEQTAS